MYMLDTNIVSDMIRNPQGAARQRVAIVGENRVVTSIVVACELRFGAERRKSARLTAQMEAVLATLPTLPLGDDVDERYARARAALERRCTPIGTNDMLIAAHALSLGATLVSDSEREFRRVEGLSVENWLRD